MPCIKYIDKTFHRSSIEIIDQANEIIQEFLADGYKLTLRQLYYQFVSLDLIPNTMKSYNRLGSIINDARLAGLIDWHAIEDRTRKLESVSHWANPAEIIEICAEQFRIDKWADQPYWIEVWIEKQALEGVIEGVCTELDVSYLSCKGYTSQSEMWEAGKRFLLQHQDTEFEQQPIIIHLGDHDPSGIDMTRDIQHRLDMFAGCVKVKRIALNMNQVKKYKLPPNPAKITDSRFHGYLTEYGSESWELDALKPSVITELIRKTVLTYRDEERWSAMVEKENEHRAQLADLAENWDRKDKR